VNVFNFNPGADVYVDRDDDGVKIRFDGETFGLNPTSSGFSITNDWNNRHFTLGFDENSVLYHITRETDGDRGNAAGNIPPSEFIAEIYGYIRWLVPPVPEDKLDLDFVGKADPDEMREFLKERDVIRETSSGLQISNSDRAKAVDTFTDNPEKLGEFYQRVLTAIPFEEAKDPDSGDQVYFYPTVDSVRILFTFPDGYIGVTTAKEALKIAENAGGSQIMNHLLRSLSYE